MVADDRSLRNSKVSDTEPPILDDAQDGRINQSLLDLCHDEISYEAIHNSIWKSERRTKEVLLKGLISLKKSDPSTKG